MIKLRMVRTCCLAWLATDKSVDGGGTSQPCMVGVLQDLALATVDNRGKH
jgi:hypothetical protein